MRSDHGGENRNETLFMNLESGSERYLTGRSVHNQRIERLWRDVHEQVIGTFYAKYYDLENRRLLDINDAKHLIGLQVVYIPEVNRSAWNKHEIRTAGNKTSEQLWMAGALELSGQDYSAIQGIFSDVKWLFNVTINDISVIYVTSHRCAGALKKTLDLRSSSQRHKHFVVFFNMPVQAPTRD